MQDYNYLTQASTKKIFSAQAKFKTQEATGFQYLKKMAGSVRYYEVNNSTTNIITKTKQN